MHIYSYELVHIHSPLLNCKGAAHLRVFQVGKQLWSDSMPEGHGHPGNGHSNGVISVLGDAHKISLHLQGGITHISIRIAGI